MSERKKITNRLTELTIQFANRRNEIYATEVVLDGNTSHPKRVDIMSFKPLHQQSVVGIERGEFTCYEVKSCVEDVYSGHGINFYGDKNYLVMPMSVWVKLNKDVVSGKLTNFIEQNRNRNVPYGVIIAHDPQYGIFENDGELDRWELEIVIGAMPAYREKSLVELLFALLNAKNYGR